MAYTALEGQSVLRQGLLRCRMLRVHHQIILQCVHHVFSQSVLDTPIEFTVVMTSRNQMDNQGVK